MSVFIKKVNESQYTINGKEIYRDSNGNWVAREELTTAELKVFRSSALLQSEENNNKNL